MRIMQRRNAHQQQQSTGSSSIQTPSSTVISNTTTLQQQQNVPISILQKQSPLHMQQSRSNVSKTSNGSNGLSNSSGSKQQHSILRIWVLVLIIIILTFIISLFPEQRQMMVNTEQQMEQVALATEQQLEREIMDYWLSSKQYYDAATAGGGGSNSDTEHNAADVRMRQQSSKWVDDEKKLKVALQVLVERQARGMDLGVPVLTRYLGESVPVFYSKDDPTLNQGITTVEAWNTIIQQKYDTMRIEENQWRDMIATTLLSSSTDRG